MKKKLIVKFVEEQGLDRIQLGYIEPYIVESTLESLGYTDKNGVDYNGWEVDFRIIFIKSEQKDILFTGSWYYGNYWLQKI